MAISVDVVISGKTTTSVEGKTQAAVITTNLQEDKLGTKGGIVSGSILPHQTDAVNLGSPSKRFLNLYAKSAHLAADSLHLGDEATISASAGGGFSFDTEGETVFGDIKVRNLTVTGVQSVISSTDLAVKDNIIIINSGEAGAGITLTSGGLVVDRGTLENATILFNDATDRFELNFPISVDGSEVALVPDLITTGQTLQGQITTNDADISTLSGDLITTGISLTNTIISTGNHLDSLRNTLSGNLITTGQTLTTDISTVSSNLVSTGVIIDDVSGNLITTGQTLQTQITSNDSDISALQASTGELQEVKFNKVGGTISGEILPSSSGTINIGSPSLPFRSGYFDDLIVSADSIRIGEDTTLSAPAGGGLDFSTTGTITFGDVSIKNLTVTGARTVVETTDTAIKDNIIVLNSGESGAGITLSSGGLVIDRGSATDANILFNDSADRFEVNSLSLLRGVWLLNKIKQEFSLKLQILLQRAKPYKRRLLQTMEIYLL